MNGPPLDYYSAGGYPQNVRYQLDEQRAIEDKKLDDRRIYLEKLYSLLNGKLTACDNEEEVLQLRNEVRDIRNRYMSESYIDRNSEGLSGVSNPIPFTSQTLDDPTNPKDLIGQSKPPISYIPPSSIVHLAAALENGAKKYGAYNWRTKKVQSLIYLDAAFRHLLAFLDGEEVAEDSGVHHLAHAMASCAILLDAIENKALIDNRPKKGNTNEIIKRFTKTSSKTKEKK